MKSEYDFRNGKHGRVLPEPPVEPGKARITIRLDEDIVDYSARAADKSGEAIGYQTFINAALREYVEGKAPKFEDTLRRIIREELERTAA